MRAKRSRALASATQIIIHLQRRGAAQHFSDLMGRPQCVDHRCLGCPVGAEVVESNPKFVGMPIDPTISVGPH